MEDPNKNDRILSEVSPADLKVKKNLEDDLKKAKDIAELGAQAINSAYIASLFDSEMSLAGLLTENPLLSDIYKNVQKLVYYSLKLKEDNLKLNNRVTNLLESSDNNNSKTIVQELQASKSTLEKENAELTEKIKIMKKSNEEWQQKMETLNIKVQTAKEKKKNLNVKDVETATEKLEEDVEVQTLKTTVQQSFKCKKHFGRRGFSCCYKS
uniref:Uncharacterized protein n=1 Tax=Panagrolaimus superbus TaxID=310955 RepID=A0A914YTQ1_9BILA